MDSLAGVVVVVPYTRRSVCICAGDVAVESVRGWVVQDLPKVRCRVEDLAKSNIRIVRLELGQVANQRGVVAVKIGCQGREISLILKGRSLVKGCEAASVLFSRRHKGRWKLTRHGVEHKIPHAIIVQVLQQTEILGHDVVNGARGVLR